LDNIWTAMVKNKKKLTLNENETKYGDPRFTIG
jgi:hypothetical protein